MNNITSEQAAIFGSGVGTGKTRRTYLDHHPEKIATFIDVLFHAFFSSIPQGASQKKPRKDYGRKITEAERDAIALHNNTRDLNVQLKTAEKRVWLQTLKAEFKEAQGQPGRGTWKAYRKRNYKLVQGVRAFHAA
jgi:hypothetical protein